MTKDRIHIEPQQASELDFYAAHASGQGVQLHDPHWPGEHLRASDPTDYATRKHDHEAGGFDAPAHVRAANDEPGDELKPFPGPFVVSAWVAAWVGGLLIMLAAGWGLWIVLKAVGVL